MDPPYPNVSAERSATYNTLDMYDLFKLPVAQLTKPSTGLVCCWITHRARHRRILIEKLFPAWKVQLIAEWYWLKVISVIISL
jgi:N6-adenosine-specific RNA methylase IME4